MLQMGTYALGYVDTHHDSVEISEAPAPRRAIRVDHQHLRPSRMKLNGRPQKNRGVFRDGHNGGIPAGNEVRAKFTHEERKQKTGCASILFGGASEGEDGRLLFGSPNAR